jgi:integrase/recombinase XerD
MRNSNALTRITRDFSAHVEEPATAGPATIYRRMLMSKPTERTRAAYASDLADFATFLGVDSLEHVPDAAWRELDPAHVAAYLEHLKNTVSHRTGQPLATATIARRITAVRELLTEATYLGHWNRDKLEYLVDRITPPQVTHEHHAGISPEEQRRLLGTADAQPGLKGLRDYALLRLWLDTGLRRAELAHLSVKDLKVREGQPVIDVRHGKGNRRREIGLEAYTAHVLKQWIERSGQSEDPERPLFVQVRKVGRGADGEYQVINPDKHLSGTALWKLVRWYAEKAAIESDISPHSFRVAWVTDTLKGGARLRHVTAQGGWTTSRMPEQVYDRSSYREPASRWRKTPLPRRTEAEQGEMELGGV